jgi:lactoylglutathione lyase
MKIEHLAIWVDDLEMMRRFYTTYFDAASNEKYTMQKRDSLHTSLSFGENKTRLELMHREDIHDSSAKRGFTKGIAHFAISAGSKEDVDQLTERLRAEKYIIESEPRLTGDGYYESVVLDPEGNYVEITV